MPLLTWIAILINVIVNVQQVRENVLLKLQVVNDQHSVSDRLLSQYPLIVGAQNLILRCIEVHFARLLEGALRKVGGLRFLQDLVPLEPRLDVARIVLFEQLLHDYVIFDVGPRNEAFPSGVERPVA